MTAMDGHETSEAAPPVTKQLLRQSYRQELEEWRRRFAEGTATDFKLTDVVVMPRAVQVKKNTGSVQHIEDFYPNGDRDFNPTWEYNPPWFEHFGPDWTLNAQGIYYRDGYSPDRVTAGRKVWVPTLENAEWDEPGEVSRIKRAQVIAEHNCNNETWNKSEYAWEADAWSDVFGQMRNDPVLAVDKRQFSKDLPDADPIFCKLTGASTVIQRIPDATFGLTTFSEYEPDLSVCATELRRTRLEKLLLHRKCGLLADPKWGETDLVFPFAVYEAKGWAGDYREARRQACLAGATYLDMLDDLARKPGPVGSVKPYQTITSHYYQVFALTSFGAHWHLLVGYRRPREEDEYGGRKDMSETVYIFQKIWSGRVTDRRTAWELLTLVDQIHLWAVTEFRTFVLEHLRPWHTFCDQNYLLDWDSIYDTSAERKRKRKYSEDCDLPLPSWTNLLTELARHKIHVQAKKSLERAIEEHQQLKGKAKCLEDSDSVGSHWQCYMDHCCSTKPKFESGEALLNHMRCAHDLPKWGLWSMRLLIEQGEKGTGRDSLPDPSEDDLPGPSKKRVRVC